MAVEDLSVAELQRYSRHLMLADVGVAGQQRLKAARVLCIGAGGLGSPAALYLAAAGVGTLGLVDFDVVDVTNLQRQILFTTADVGRAKLAAARERLEAMNPEVRVEAHETRFSAANALALVSAYDIVLDGSDNFPTRYLVNDACVIAGRPNAYGAIFRFEGQASVFATKDGPCYRCLHPHPPPEGLVPNCAEAGVLGVLPGIVGTIQATEAIKLILGIGEPLVGRFLIYDALRMRFRELKLRKDPDCPVCGTTPSITAIHEEGAYCETQNVRMKPGAAGTEEGRVQADGSGTDITVKELKERMDRGDAPLVVDVREPHEHAINQIPGAVLIPVGQLQDRLSEIDPAREVVLHCKSGGRSSRAVKMLHDKGYTKARNLTGGVTAWVTEIDPSQPKY